MFPSPAELAHFVCGCRDRGLAFKATAGLHHPIRDGIAHGFLNLLGAAVLAHAEGAGPRDLVPVLLEQDAGAFEVTDEAFTVRGHALGAEAVAAARERAVRRLRQLLVLRARRGPEGAADPLMRRREFLAGAAGVALGAGFWQRALLAAARAAGVLLRGAGRRRRERPAAAARASRSRLIARANEPVAGTGYPWHVFPDGQATFATEDGGWVLVSNSESLAASGAGSSAIRFRADGEIVERPPDPLRHERQLRGRRRRRGARWLSCEEHDYGHVWECDPMRAGPGRRSARRSAPSTTRPSPSTPPRGALYLTEDRPDGGFYRFTPDRARRPRLGPARGRGRRGRRRGWRSRRSRTRARSSRRRASRSPGTRAFNGGEGIWYDGGTVHFSTKGDNRVWAYDTATGALGTIYDKAAAGPGAPLSGVDNLTVNPAGEVFVCEDGDDMQICVIDAGRHGRAVPAADRRGGGRAGRPRQRARRRDLRPVAPAAVLLGAARVRLRRRLRGARAVPRRGRHGGRRPGQRPGRPAARRRRACGCGRPSGSASRRSARAGWQLDLRLGDAVSVVAALRSDELGRVPGKRGSTARPHTVTLARARRKGREEMRLHLRVGRAGLLRLRGRRTTRARITVVAHGRDGRRASPTRAVRDRPLGRRRP